MRPDRFLVAARLAMAATVVAVGVGVAVVSQQSAAAESTAASVEPGGSAGLTAQDADAGEAVYGSNCASCHQAGGAGVPGTFPPLAGNPNVADAAYVESVVRDGKSGPIDVNGESYDGVMAPMASLSDDEVADVAAYVASLAEGGAAPAPAPDEAPAELGTVEAGEALFVGSDTLENGGGACSGCHAAGSVGNLGGSGLGPNLTNSAEALGGEVGLAAWLANPPSPTMMPIFAEHPLSPADIADLTQFLVDAPNQKAPSDTVDWLLVAGIVGTLVLLGGMAIAYRGMRQTYAQRLQAKNKVRAGDRAARRTP